MKEWQKLIKNIVTVFAYALAIGMIVAIITFSISVGNFLNERNKSSNKDEYTWKDHMSAQRNEKKIEEDLKEISRESDKIVDTKDLQDIESINNVEIKDENQEDTMIIGSKEEVSRTYNFRDIRKISVEHSTGTLIIKEGKSEEFIVETENVSEELKVEINDKGELSIIDKMKKVHFELHFNKKKSITIRVPKGVILDQVKINGGVGDVELNDIVSNKLIVNAGVGNFEADDITVDDVVIHSGVGNMKLYNINFKDTKINGGVGNIQMDGVVEGLLDIESGVGNIKVELKGNIEDYDIRGSKGLGSIKINGEKRESLSSSTGKYKIKIDGGVGDIKLDVR